MSENQLANTRKALRSLCLGVPFSSNGSCRFTHYHGIYMKRQALTRQRGRGKVRFPITGGQQYD